MLLASSSVGYQVNDTSEADEMSAEMDGRISCSLCMRKRMDNTLSYFTSILNNKAQLCFLVHICAYFCMCVCVYEYLSVYAYQCGCVCVRESVWAA